MDLIDIERIGAIMGIVAFLGLAVLALLLFSQARDVRRLRDWAGRAPERAAVAAQQAQETYAQQAAAIRRSRRDGGGWASDVRGPVLVGLGVVVLAVGTFFGVSALVSEPEREAGEPTRADQASDIVPNEVNVAVFNGTDVPGLAAQMGAFVEENGFPLGPVTNTPRPYERSMVMYRRGRQAEAEFVGRRLGIGTVRLIEPEIEQQAGQSDVSIVVGGDRAEDAPAEGAVEGVPG